VSSATVGSSVPPWARRLTSASATRSTCAGDGCIGGTVSRLIRSLQGTAVARELRAGEFDLPRPSRYLRWRLNLSPIRKPPRVRTGDVVGVVAPAGAVDDDRLQAGIRVLEGWGVRVDLGRGVCERWAYLAGRDEVRAADMQRMMDTPGLHAIFCARGG